MCISRVLHVAVDQWVHYRRRHRISAGRHSRHGRTAVPGAQSDSGVADGMHWSPAHTETVSASDAAQSSTAILGLINGHEGRQLQVRYHLADPDELSVNNAHTLSAVEDYTHSVHVTQPYAGTTADMLMAPWQKLVILTTHGVLSFVSDMHH